MLRIEVRHVAEMLLQRQHTPLMEAVLADGSSCGMSRPQGLAGHKAPT